MTADPAPGPADGPGRSPEAGLDAALAAFAARVPVLVALDFDGVCAPIVDDPTASRMLAGTRAAVGRLEDAGCRVALVSGRSLAGPSGLVAVADAPPGWLLVGGHGAEVPDGAADPGTEAVQLLDEDQAALLVEISAEVEAVVDGAPGTAVEHKPTAVVLHTRLADPETALHTTEAVLEGPGARPGVHVKRGKDVVELAVLQADKGSAVQRLRARTAAAAVLYAGDDVTDEDAFGVLDPASGDVGVKVGPGDTAAAHRVGAPDDVTALLERLADLVAAAR